MRRNPWKFVLAFGLALLGATASAAEVRTISLYDVHRAEAPPVIDGQLNDACWQNQPVITDMVLRDAKTRQRAKVQTKTTLLYDDQAFYIGIHLDEPYPQGLRKNIQKYDGSLWWDDSVEIYLEVGASHKEFFKLIANPLGTRNDSRAKDTPMGFQYFDWGTGAEWTVKAHIGKDFWSLEYRVPWTDLECKVPQPGDLWTFEITRFRYAGQQDPKDGKKEYSTWSYGATYFNPASFGNIIFSGSTADLERMFVDKLKPAFGGAMRIYGREGEIRYVDYKTLHADKAGEARNAVRSLRRRFAAIRAGLSKRTAAELDKRLSDLHTTIESVANSTPSAITAETLEKHLAACRAIDWTLKYHELNASLPAAPGADQAK